jgi:hypothetical protein
MSGWIQVAIAALAGGFGALGVLITQRNVRRLASGDPKTTPANKLWEVTFKEIEAGAKRAEAQQTQLLQERADRQADRDRYDQELREIRKHYDQELQRLREENLRCDERVNQITEELKRVRLLLVKAEAEE